MTKRPIVAFLYDFDKTLCTTDMEDYAFIPSLGYTPSEFWAKANGFGYENKMDGLLAYMYTMIRECAAQAAVRQRAFVAAVWGLPTRPRWSLPLPPSGRLAYLLPE